MNSEQDPTAERADDVNASAGSTEPRSASPEANLWILSWWQDLLFFVATPLLLVPLLLALQTRLDLARLYLVVLTIGAVGHHLPCFLRAYGDRDMRHRFRWRLTFGPIVMLSLGGGFAFANLDGLAVILLLWGVWHILTQQYGFMRIYDAKLKSFEKATIRLDFLICFFWFGAGVVFSPDRTYQLLDRLYLAGVPLMSSTWIAGFQLFWGLLTVVVTIAFVMNYIFQRRQGQPPSLVKLITMAIGIGLWWYSMVNVRELLLGVLLFELYHDIQYVALARYYGCRRAETSDRMSPLASRLFQRGLLSLTVYLGLIALYGLPAYFAGITPTWLEFTPEASPLFKTIFGLVAASTMLHFYYDSFLWPIREQEVREALDVPAAPSSVGEAWVLSQYTPHLLKFCLLIVPFGWMGYTQWHSDGPSALASYNLAEAVPGSWEARVRLGTELQERGQLEEALQQFQEATKLHPTATEPRCQLGYTLLLLNRLEDSAKQYALAVENAPDSVPAQRGLGMTLFALGNKKDGYQHLLTATRLAPTDASLLCDLAIEEAKMQDFESGLKSINRALELDPSNPLYWNARGNIYWNQKNLDDAMGDYDKALELDPNLVKAFRNRAQVWLASGDTQSAIDDLSEAIERDGSVSRDYVIRGDLFATQRQYDKTRADYAEAILREPVYVEPMQRMIQLLTTCPDESYRNLEQAIVLAETVCRRSNYADPHAIQVLAATYATAGKFDEAIQWQEQAASVAPAEAQPAMRQRIEVLKKARESQRQQANPAPGSVLGPGPLAPTAPSPKAPGNGKPPLP